MEMGWVGRELTMERERREEEPEGDWARAEEREEVLGG